MQDKLVKIIDLGKRVHVNLLSYSPNNKYLACASEYEGIIIIKDILGEIKLNLINYSGYITALTISSDSKYILSGDEKGFIIVWDIVNGNQIMMFQGNDDQVNSLACNNSNNLASTSFNDEVNIWEIPSGKLIKTLKPKNHIMSTMGDTDILEDMSYSSDYKYLATLGRYSQRVWDAENNKEIGFIFRQEEPFGSVAFSPDSKNIAFGLQGKVIFYTSDLKHLIKIIDEESNNFIENLFYTPDGEYIIYIPNFSISKNSKGIAIINTLSSEKFYINESGNYLSSIAFSFDSKYLAYTIGDTKGQSQIKILKFTDYV